VLWEEISACYAAAGGAHPSLARELARRAVPGRAGLIIFSAPRADPMRLIRIAEDIFAVAGYRSRLKGESADLDRIRAVAREAPYVESALAARVRVLPGSRAGRRLRFRVVARMVGDQEFRRVDLQRAIERGISERGDHTWRLTEGEADIELWATMIESEVLLAIRLSDESMRHREYKVAHTPGSLRPAAAAALGWLSEAAPDDVVLDPLCGAGTVLIERAQLGRYSLLIGADHDPSALAAARENIGPRYKPIELHQWDAVALPLPEASVSKVVTNLPWGIRHGSHEGNRRLYPGLIAEFRRVVRKGGLIVMLTAETRLMTELISRGRFRPEKIVRVTIQGTPATVYVSRV
jgi:23S rRNA G2445 N2-methylase RlmL